MSAREKLILLKDERHLDQMTLDEISLLVQRPLKKVSFNPTEIRKNAELAFQLLPRFGIKYTCLDFSDFPAMLREMKDPPFMLFYRGNLEVLQKKCISVVGTRRCGANGKKAAETFSKEACDDGCCIVSGLAYGIDGFAHGGALKSENPSTVAVLPSGIDIITPSAHKKLAAKILEKGGLLLSEYLPGTPAQAFRYVQRNRIVAALSADTVVIQAPPGSGAMITAGLVLDYNRNIFFHIQCFSPEGIAISQFSELQLRKELEQGKKVEYKLNNSPKAFVQDGAMVISSYGEFKEAVIAPRETVGLFDF
ncbi:MAG: DNA-processing protein DprA [Treponema sp.]|nr:DNA-processing protein DprA [Candidatus Treponema equifaecale]